MKSVRLKFPEVMLITPQVFGDDRGFFFESFNQKLFNDATGLNRTFVQDNHSKSQQGVLRGLHYQLPPNAQGKLVRVVHGEVFDVVVDIRKSSPNFAQWLGVTLTAANYRQLWIPEGFAHGFLTLSETAEFLYKTTKYYVPQNERCIVWNDADINIHWPLEYAPTLSEKDKIGQPMTKLELFG